MIRLLKPLDYYQKKYGTWQYGLQKMYLLMEKQHNRGQEGAGLATVKLDMPPGEEYIWRERMEGKNAIQDIFAKINCGMALSVNSEFTGSMNCKAENPFAGELYLGHLRYSTTGKSGLSYIHPFLRRHNWKARTLLLAGNFNLTNVDAGPGGPQAPEGRSKEEKEGKGRRNMPKARPAAFAPFLLPSRLSSPALQSSR